jgi:hypothetical protein
VIAALYARKSTEQTGVADDAKSVTSQTSTRAFTTRKDREDARPRTSTRPLQEDTAC